MALVVASMMPDKRMRTGARVHKLENLQTHARGINEVNTSLKLLTSCTMPERSPGTGLNVGKERLKEKPLFSDIGEASSVLEPSSSPSSELLSS